MAFPRLIDGTVLLFMAVVAFGLYFPAINGPFVFDDTSNILLSPAVRMSNLSAGALRDAAFDNVMPGRPVANVSFALNYFLGQYEAAGYHIVNILIHSLTGFLLFLFIRVTLRIIDGRAGRESSPVIPFAAAVLWLAHPMQSQAVAYIVQRMTSLAALFYLLSMLLYVYGRLSENRQRRAALFSGCAASAILALGSKETAATLPLFILLYEWYFLQGLQWDWLKKRLPAIALALAAFLAAAFVFLGTDPVARILASYEERHFTLLQRVLTEMRVVVFYMGQLLFPHPSRLSLEHDFPLSLFLFYPLSTLYAAAFLAVLAGGAILWARRQPLLSFAVVWYLGNLVIESSVIGLELVFEHRNYLPSMFFILFLVILADRLIRSGAAKSIFACITLFVCAFWTYERSTVWSDHEALVHDCIEKAPNRYRMHYNLGTLLSEQGRHDEAISAFSQAEQIYPRDPSARDINLLYTNLGNALSRQGRHKEGSRAYYRALQFNERDANAYLGLGHNYFVWGDYPKAVLHYRKGVDFVRDPNVMFPLHSSLGKAFMAMGRYEEAVSHYNIALSIQPGSQEVRLALQELRRIIGDRG